MRSRTPIDLLATVPETVGARGDQTWPAWEELGGLSDEELCALALGADPNEEIAPDAVALDLHRRLSPGALPQWYMPGTVVRAGARWHRPLAIAVVVAFLVIDAFGLCATYGSLVLA